MEGVPRLYMISLPAKQCDSNQKPDFASAISHQIQRSYNREPSLYSADIDALHGLRQSAIDAVMSSVCSINECTVLKRYYAHMVRLTEKFPKLLHQRDVEAQESYDQSEIADVEESIPPLIFTWKRVLGGKINRHRRMKNDITVEQKKSSRYTKDVEAAIAAYDNGNIGYEMQCVLYNLGVIHSRLAAGQDRSPPIDLSNMSTTAETESPSNTALKIACTHLQCAAWAFEQLLGGGGTTNNEYTKWHLRQQPPVTSRVILEFAYNVTLAQAQECILEKSMMDGRKSLIIAKVSAMICEYFARAIDAVNRMKREPYCVSSTRLEKWRLYSEFKCRYYGAVTALFQGQYVQDQLQQMGTRVSYYRRAVNLLGRAGQISENSVNTEGLMTKDDDSADDDYYYYLKSEDIRGSRSRSAIAKELEMRRDTLSFAMDVAAAKWRAAKSENELIYHESVVPVLSDDDDNECLGISPSLTTTTASNRCQLERVKGASLVKPIGFNIDDPELLAIVIANNNESSCGTITTLFRDLIPADIRYQVDTYRLEKCTLEENMRSLCQAADDKLIAFVDTLQLECLEMYKDNSDGNNEKSDTVELPQQLVNCCAAYQALLEQQRQEKSETFSVADEEDQLDIDMARLSTAVQAVDGMLDEIDRLLKTEEHGDSEYRRTMGQPYDYSAGRMRELRREASRYREAHVGRARDSWVTLSRAVRDRRRRDLELLALPPAELAAKLPPARPTRTAISAEVAAAGVLTSSSTNDNFTRLAESTDQNYDSEIEDNGQLRQLQQDSIDRLDRLNVVVNKLQEVRDQRQLLLSRLKDEMDQEEKIIGGTGQEDVSILGDLRGSDIDIKSAVKKKLDARYGQLVNLIQRNLSAQLNILDAVRMAYARASAERRAYANAMQRRRTVIASLLDAYNSFATANGGTPLAASSESSAASPTSGLLPDPVLAERCTKGLEFYQRLLTNVSKLLQRVKGTCQVQTEQRDQIIKQHQQWEAVTQSSDDGLAAPVSGPDNLHTTVSTIADHDHHREDLVAFIESFGSNGVLNQPTTPLSGTQLDQQHRRLSPFGSEQQQQQQQQHCHQYCYPQMQSSSSSNIDYYDYYHDGVTNKDYIVSGNSAQQQSVASSVAATNPIHSGAHNIPVGSTMVPTRLVNSITTCISSPLSSVPYNYYNYQLPMVTPAAGNPMLPSPSYNNVMAHASSGGGVDASTSAMMNTLRLTDNNSISQNIVSPYNQSSSSGGFPNATAAVAALQRPLSAQFSGGGTSSIGSGGIGYSYHHPTTILSSGHQQLYLQQHQQEISTAVTIGNGSTDVGTPGIFLQQQQQKLIAGSGVTPVCGQSPLTLSSPLMSTVNVNNGSITAVSANSSSIGNIRGFSTATNLFHQPMMQQQQQIQLYQQQPQLYQQQPQLYQQQSSQIYQQQQQQQQQQQICQLTSTNGINSPGNFYYSPQQQRHPTQTSQLYHPSQHQQLQLQPATVLTTSAITANLQQPLALSNSGISNYYQQLQQYHLPTTMAAGAAPAVPLNTAVTSLSNYYYQQPPMVMAYNQQQQQFCQQQLPPVVSGGLVTNATIMNLLDDDLVLSGPSPIQPEKISGGGGSDAATTSI